MNCILLITVCSVVSTVLLQRDLLPSPVQRVVAVTLLQQLPAAPSNSSTPFLPNLLQLIQDKDANQHSASKKCYEINTTITEPEKRFIATLLTETNVKDVRYFETYNSMGLCQCF